MITALPFHVQSYLEQLLLGNRAFFCASFSGRGQINTLYGQPEAFGLSSSALEIVELLAGLDVDQSAVLPFLQFGNGQTCHLHLVPAAADADSTLEHAPAFVLLLAVENSFEEIGAQQQITNELRITTDRQSQTISALTQAQKLLRESESELKRAHDLKSLFISKMSHEFGTPITAVLGRMRLLEAKLAGDGDAAEHLQVIRRGVLHLHQLVVSVLDEARLEQGTLRLEPSRVSLSELAKDLTSLFASQAQEKSLRFESAVEQDFLLWIDGLRVKQILINLISNGLKYTHEGTVALFMSFREGKLTANITDTGPGMTREQASSLFRPFRRLNEKATASGTGLGLVISRDLAQHMGGNIEVRSTLGEGSSFIFTLPCERVVVAVESSNKCENVLIVDDDDDIRSLLSAILEREGMKTECAENGLAAELRFRARAPDVILLDMQLGDENGAHVARKLRSLGCRAKIIALSASTGGETSAMAINAGCDAFLGKPVNFDRLKDLMEEL